MIHASVRCAISALAIFSSTYAGAEDAPRAPANLRVEYRENPIDVGVSTPRFSWEPVDARRNAVQSAYRVLVSQNWQKLHDEKGDEWDSGKVPTSDTNEIVYAGKPLVLRRTYYWTVRTWDAAGVASPWSEKASFVVAPLASADWDATWIEADHFQDDPKAIGYHSAWAQTEDDTQWIQYDFGSEVVFDRLRLHPARPDGDPSKPGVLFPLRVKAYADGNDRFDKTFMRIGEYTWQDIPNAGAEPLDIELTRFKLRYLRLVTTKMQKVEGKGYAFALGEFEVLNGDTNIAPLARVTVGSSLDEPGWKPTFINDQRLLPGAPSKASPQDALPRLRRSFVCEGQPLRAFLNATALGIYDLEINGQRVGEQRLAPGWTDYKKRVPFQTFEVGSMLNAGENVISVQLAPGWYAGRLGIADQIADSPKRAIYGDEPRFLAQVDITYDNGRRQHVATDDTWRWTRAGPLLAADLFDGETYDTQREQNGWDMPQYSPLDWRVVKLVPGAGPSLFAEQAPPVRAWGSIAPTSITQVSAATASAANGKPAVEAKPAVFLVDFAQNISGVVRLRLGSPRGTPIVLRHGEMLDEKGALYTGNLRGAEQTDRFIAGGGGMQTIEPRATIHGFRYVEISGLSTKPEKADVQALVIGTALDETGKFECSDPMLNKLWENVGWTLRANYVALPTDCPQRDERLGWMGDIQTFAPSAFLRYDMSSAFEQWLAEVRGAQAEDGRFADFSPNPYDSNKHFSGAPAWSDAGVLVPWTKFLFDHDLRTLSASVDGALRWIEFVHAKNPKYVWSDARANDYGDWLNGDSLKADDWKPGGNEVPKDLFATAFFAHSCEITAKMAFAAGRLDDARKAHELAENVKKAFRETFKKPDGTLTGDTQAGYALAIDFDMAESHEQTQAWVARLAQRIADQGALTTGMLTTPHALLALSNHGQHDVALSLARKKTFPSWGFEIENGATTLWERMDGFVPGRGFQDPGMNSFDHFAFGAVAEWMVRAIAGFDPDDQHTSDGAITQTALPGGKMRSSADSPGALQHFRLAPHVSGGLTSASYELHSIAGLVRSVWKLEGDSLKYECTVPANTKATLTLPAKSADVVTENGTPLDKVVGASVTKSGDGSVQIELGSGTYAFASKLHDRPTVK